MFNCAHCRNVPAHNELWFSKVMFHKMVLKILIDKQYNGLYAATIDMTSDTTYHANDLIHIGQSQDNDIHLFQSLLA